MRTEHGPPPPTEPLAKPVDVVLAAALLTRAPIPLDLTPHTARAARAAWAYPLIGAAVGAVGGAAAAGAAALGAPSLAAGALGLAVLLWITGALHEDGLADTADGLFGGRPKEQALDIMKDSRVGVYGAAALCLGLLIRASCLGALAASGGALTAIAAAAAAGAASRAPLAAIMAFGLPARPGGLGAATGRPPKGAAALALAAAALTLAVFWAVGAPAAALLAGGAAALAAAALTARWAARRIGGWTGDTLGASQQTAEIAALVALASALAP